VHGRQITPLDPLVWRLLCLFAFAIPLSIFLGQLALIVTSAVAIPDWWRNGRAWRRTPVDLPIAAFLVSAFVAAVHGLDAGESLWGLRTYLQVVIVYLVLHYAHDERRTLELVGFFLAGMTLATGYTLVRAASPVELPRVFLGQMTQSGQLLFAIGLATSLVAHRAPESRRLVVPLVCYVVALLANLKRGVWLGTLAIILALGAAGSRRLVLAVVGLVAVTLLLVSPVRERLEHTTRDLFLPGNRYDIWSAAVDVVHRFPLGVGRKNGTILRDYPNIPPHHKHAHNNLLQITLESGLPGLAAFSWWMIAFGRLAARTWRATPQTERTRRALAAGVLASFVGFHVAGLVEYNFGDTEVLEILFLTMGLGLRLGESDAAETAAGSREAL
jgi:O-antigen ligase